MAQKTTIRDHIEDYIEQNGMNINRFANISGVNSGTLSRILSQKQPISMGQLERITSGLNLPTDHFYEMYIEECFFNGTPTWRRLRPFLFRCADTDRLDCIERVVTTLLDNLAYTPMLFETAEELFHQGKKAAAAILYKHVSTSEKYQHSERLAICQYKLFLISIGNDQDANLRAATLFEGYVERLDQEYQLDAYKHLAHVYGSLHRWDKVDMMAKEMHRIATILYNQNQLRRQKPQEGSRSPEKPVYYYILYSYLIRSTVCEHNGDYEGMKHYIQMYSDGDWIQEKSSEVQAIIEQFQEWAKADLYICRLMTGHYDVLPEYVKYIVAQGVDSYKLKAFLYIIEAANRHNWNVDPYINQFSVYLSYEKFKELFGEYNQQVYADEYARLLVEVAMYHLRNGKREGIEILLQSLDFSIAINNKSNIIKSVALFEQYRVKADKNDINQYQKLIREVQ
ncbi:transcriptional regulator [Paenibacillus campinasensis]|uniref:Transcriptional regulator n=1 Tax=Paenibacillus campinasensis TaxID=66347 RepID=A0ABW9T280_9BACL|nr:helix-turn-helix transcriptional regulator [Paenibacillus campinasensis]MUG65361.1 transcriptional regulator [Paenibacillus campinasensis]